MTVEIETLITARKRGWSLNEIAASAGVTRQAVQGRLREYDLGQIELRRPRHSRVGRIYALCDHCAKGRWVTPEAFNANARRSEHYFCSYACSGKFTREIGEDIIMRAIDMRLDGEAWLKISKALGFTMQSLQIRIWVRLHETNLLSFPVVMGIWSPLKAKWRNRQPSWIWLENKTGLTVRGGRSG